MNKCLLIILLVFGTGLMAQEKKPRPTLRHLRQQYKYGPSGTHQGPGIYQNEEPRSISNEVSEDDGGYSTRQGTMEYSDEDMDRDRNLRPLPEVPDEELPENYDGSEPGGERPRDPAMGTPEYEPDPDPDYEKADSPDIEMDGPSEGFWRVLLFILGGTALAFIIYLIIKNYRPTNRPAPAAFSLEELNPETITKTELELRLEEAMLREDYRECVRIYFTFILKELIRLRRIRWKKELTNRDYLMQMYRHDTTKEFETSVHIFDLVWYGDYRINLQQYRQVESPLASYYQRLNEEHA